jgi:transposase-like protein
MARKTNNKRMGLQEAIQHFSNPENVLAYMTKLRWPDGVVTCPTCGREGASFLKNQNKWQCKSAHPKRQFSAKVGTIFEDSPIPMDKWLVAVWMLSNCRNGVSSYELARTIGVTQKSAWFMLHRIRYAMKSGTFKIGGGGNRIEADETFVGPNPMRMHKDRRARLQQVAANNYGFKAKMVGKTIVMGMLDRDARKVRAMVIPDVRRATLQDRILNNVKGGSIIYTDEHPAYKYALADKFAHDVVNHLTGYVSGQVHTNGIENFWSLLKRGLRGTYVAVEPFHLERYVDEQVFRFNNRGSKKHKTSDFARFTTAMSQIAGKRLTFAEVTGKVGETIN